MYVASCCASGPGMAMQKLSACRNRRSVIQRRRSTSSSCMIAIWPAGPPKLMHPSLSQNRSASRSLGVSAAGASLVRRDGDRVELECPGLGIDAERMRPGGREEDPVEPDARLRRAGLAHRSPRVPVDLDGRRAETRPAGADDRDAHAGEGERRRRAGRRRLLDEAAVRAGQRRARPAARVLDGRARLVAEAYGGKGLSLTPSAGSILSGGRSVTSMTLGPGNYEYLQLETDGSNYRVTTATRDVIGITSIIIGA